MLCYEHNKTLFYTKTYHNMIHIFVAFLLVSTSLGPVLSLQPVPDSGHRQLQNCTLNPHKDIQKLRRVQAYLKKINKPAVKTIQSPDGDVIDCVPSHLQPAFDHPQLKGQKPLKPAVRPKGHNLTEAVSESFQLWRDTGESCPKGTVPIRRTTEQDILRASSLRRYGRIRRHVRRDSTGYGHEHAVVFENGDQYYGAKASLSVWAPRVTNEYEFSLSQIWIISGSFGNDLNTIEAGWQLYVHVSFRLALNYMEIITRGSSHTGQVMHTRLRDVTTCFVLVLSKPTTRLPLEQQSHQGPLTMADSSISD
ncbi:hypothetical protein ERO13_A12G272700v2 [Gossypium hirsutum]|uniref:Neprosin PEP catalytic domain-containing protein n=1 Tax=Gossypium barbadense TaxID=3634 RepID=A0A5J5TGR8_GOSBA|nr:hypothetical protein ES319_A12G282300v1 [Gossypium barbadense]KAG4172423.1 hypothetical protein ERO13_A12G272700v2 [Gossypium hirsutum]